MHDEGEEEELTIGRKHRSCSGKVRIVEIAILANRNNFYQFVHDFPCLLAPPRPHTFIKFILANASKPLLINSFLTLKQNTWANLLTQYSGSLPIHLPMVLQFGVELRYKGFDVFIPLDNLTSALEDPTSVKKKLQKYLVSGCVILVHQPNRTFSCSPLDLVPKYNKS